MKIEWIEKAITSYEEVIDYLIKNWTKKEVTSFTKKVHKMEDDIKLNPYMYPVIRKNPDIRKAKVSKQTSVFFLVNQNTIYLLLFWNEYRDPETLEEMISSYH